jgi:hypothetical protein
MLGSKKNRSKNEPLFLVSAGQGGISIEEVRVIVQKRRGQAGLL